MSETPTFVLSPKEDLTLLTIKYNHPHYSWEEVSEHILRQHLLLIPSDVCRDRFDQFLSIVNHRNIDVAHSWSRAEEWVRSDIRVKIPQNFIFAYKDTRKKVLEDEEGVRLACLYRYEKKLVSRLLGFTSNHKVKKINKHNQPDLGSFSRSELSIGEQDQQLVHNLYTLIKQKCEPNTVLTQQIAEQKIQLILSQILEVTNERILLAQHNSVSPITNCLELIRFIKKYRLGIERWNILKAYIEAMEVNNDNYPTIRAIFKLIQDNYLSLQQGNKSQHFDEATQKSIKSNSCRRLLQFSCSERNETNSQQFQTKLLQQQIQQRQKSHQQLQKQSRAQQSLDFTRPDSIQRCTEKEIIQSTSNSSLIPSQQNQYLHCQTNPQGSLSTFQVVITNKIVSISSKPISQMPSAQQVQVKQEPDKGTVKQEQAQSEVKYEEADNRKKKGFKRKKVPKILGKVWIILND